MQYRSFQEDLAALALVLLEECISSCAVRPSCLYPWASSPLAAAVVDLLDRSSFSQRAFCVSQTTLKISLLPSFSTMTERRKRCYVTSRSGVAEKTRLTFRQPCTNLDRRPSMHSTMPDDDTAIVTAREAAKDIAFGSVSRPGTFSKIWLIVRTVRRYDFGGLRVSIRPGKSPSSISSSHSRGRGTATVLRAFGLLATNMAG